MAIWRITQNDAGGRRLVYRNSITLQEYDCGSIWNHITYRHIVAWIVEQDPLPGDLIVLPGNVVIQIALKGASE